MGITSPCTGACALDSSGGRCVACKRTIDEIVAWASMSEAERVRITQALRGR